MDSDFNVLEYLEEIKEDNKDKWENAHQTNYKRIPSHIYTMTPNWIKVEGGIVAVYADMINSSAVNVSKYRRSLTRGKIYDIFTGALAKIFHDFDVVHLDIEGDGALGVWNGGDDRLKAFCAAVTFRTYVGKWLSNYVANEVSDINEIGVRIGIDEEEAIVKFVGVPDKDKNLVWAGEPVPTASKLCKIHKFTDEEGNEIDKDHITVSDRLFTQLRKIEEIKKSCGCDGSGGINKKSPLWDEYDIPEDRKEEFNFDKYDVLTSSWCDVHGGEFCDEILSNIASN